MALGSSGNQVSVDSEAFLEKIRHEPRGPLMESYVVWQWVQHP